jgi:transposase
VPPVPAPLVTRYAVPVCRCQSCGKTVRGQAPGLEPDQYGATAHRLGPRVKAIAHTLHYGMGIPVRKLPEVLWELAGIRVTASALTQDALKQSAADGPVGQQYQVLRDRMRDCAVVHTDDTGWSIGGTNAFLMGFFSADTAVYQIRYRHRSEEVLEIIPADFAGVLVTDRGKSYDAEVFLCLMQQKCVGHLLRNISEVLEDKTGSSRQFGLRLKGLLQQALELGDQERSPEWTLSVDRLDQELTWMLRNRVLKDDDNQRLLNGIGTQMDRDRLLTFLYVPGVDGTNNFAERMLRLAVIARKISQCSKNELGAQASAAFMSVIQTLRLGLKPLESLSTSLLGVMVGIR